MYAVNVSCSRLLSRELFVRVIERHAIGDEWVETRPDETILFGEHGQWLIRALHFTSFLNDAEILAIEPLYQRIGDAVHSTDSYCFARYDPARLRPIIRDLCREGLALGAPLWVHWNYARALASAADMLDALQSVPDFDWPESEPRLEPSLHDAIYGKPAVRRGPGGTVVALSEHHPFSEAHTHIEQWLPGVQAMVPHTDLDPAGSLCLFALDEQSGDTLNWFHAIARGVRRNDDSQRFYASPIHTYGDPWNLREHTSYHGPQLRPPLVILRLPGEPEWQGEGEEAIEKLRALAERDPG